MGTHPIFESDFDCLTETYILLKIMKGEKMKEKIEYERKNLKLDYGAKEKIEYERKNLKLDYGAKVIDGGIIDNNFVKQYHNFKIEKEERDHQLVLQTRQIFIGFTFLLAGIVMAFLDQPAVIVTLTKTIGGVVLVLGFFLKHKIGSE